MQQRARAPARPRSCRSSGGRVRQVGAPRLAPRDARCRFQDPGLPGPLTATRTVRLSFRLPYRVNFGQDICIVGSTDALGNWDPRHGLGMRWSEGDVWAVDFEVPIGPGLDWEYKYVVRNSDGCASEWAPGSNLRVPMAGAAAGAAAAAAGRGSGSGSALAAPPARVPGGVVVRDAWDGSVRDVRLEVIEDGRPPRPLSDAEREVAAFGESLAAAMEELASHLDEAERTSASGDPTSPEKLQTDRVVAAAMRKAIALNQALTASKTQVLLSAPDSGGSA